MPEFEWDELKRATNRQKHDLDLLRGTLLFDGRNVVKETSHRAGEKRFITTGEIEGRFYTVVWTWRAGSVRLVSFRRARHAEERAYRNSYG
jgi:uncharacterized DUF497 family protein